MWPNRSPGWPETPGIELPIICPILLKTWWQVKRCFHFAKHFAQMFLSFCPFGDGSKPFKNYHRNYNMISGMTIQKSQLWLRVPSSRGVTGVSLFVSDLGNHGWRVDRKATPDSMVGLKAQDHGSEVAEEWVISMDAMIIMVISWDI